MTYFLKRVQNRTEAEDLTQEVFVRLVKHGDAMAADTINGYVFTIAANLLRDRGRSYVGRQLGAHHSLDDPAAANAGLTLIEELEPERVFIGRESLRAALDAIAELDERTRNIFVLFRIEKMRQRDIAALLGLSVPTVERHVMKAVTHLHVRLKLKP